MAAGTTNHAGRSRGQVASMASGESLPGRVLPPERSRCPGVPARIRHTAGTHEQADVANLESCERVGSHAPIPGGDVAPHRSDEDLRLVHCDPQHRPMGPRPRSGDQDDLFGRCQQIDRLRREGHEARNYSSTELTAPRAADRRGAAGARRSPARWGRFGPPIPLRVRRYWC